MKFITSISPMRIEHQQFCLSTWIPHGRIVAVQPKGESAIAASAFPCVEFVETDSLGTFDGRHLNRPRIASLIAECPGMIINSDIEINDSVESFAEKWKYEVGVFKVGIRTDHEKPTDVGVLNMYGIDAFLIGEDLKQSLPDLGFAIGVCVWDYWILWHAITTGLRVEAKNDSGSMRHASHNRGWNELDTQRGMEIMLNRYGVDRSKLDVLIPLFTNRIRKSKPKRKRKRKIKK